MCVPLSAPDAYAIQPPPTSLGENAGPAVGLPLLGRGTAVGSSKSNPPASASATSPPQALVEDSTSAPAGSESSAVNGAQRDASGAPAGSTPSSATNGAPPITSSAAPGSASGNSVAPPRSSLSTPGGPETSTTPSPTTGSASPSGAAAARSGPPGVGSGGDPGVGGPGMGAGDPGVGSAGGSGVGSAGGSGVGSAGGSGAGSAGSPGGAGSSSPGGAGSSGPGSPSRIRPGGAHPGAPGQLEPSGVTVVPAPSNLDRSAASSAPRVSPGPAGDTSLIGNISSGRKAPIGGSPPAAGNPSPRRHGSPGRKNPGAGSAASALTPVPAPATQRPSSSAGSVVTVDSRAAFATPTTAPGLPPRTPALRSPGSTTSPTESPGNADRSVANGDSPTESSAAHTAVPTAAPPSPPSSVAEGMTEATSGPAARSTVGTPAAAALPTVAGTLVTASSAARLRLQSLPAPLPDARLAGPLKDRASGRGQAITRVPDTPGPRHAGTASRVPGASNVLSGRQNWDSMPTPAADASGDLLETHGGVPSGKTSAGNGTGTSMPALALLALLAFIAPRLGCRLRSRHELAVAAPLVLLLDHPG
jgi:hypothetical protein